MCSQDVTQKPGQVMQYNPHPKRTVRSCTPALEVVIVDCSVAPSFESLSTPAGFDYSFDNLECVVRQYLTDFVLSTFYSYLILFKDSFIQSVFSVSFEVVRKTFGRGPPALGETQQLLDIIQLNIFHFMHFC